MAAEQLAELAPGSDLAWLLEVADLTAADDYAVVEVVAAWQRLGAWAAAGAARAAAVLADRASMNPTWPDAAGEVADPNVAGEELAMRLGCSRRQGRFLVRDGRAFDGALMWTGEALAAGEIDAQKARLLVAALADQPEPLALDVQAAVLPGASRRTPTQLRRDIERALVACDPDGAAVRHETAVRSRRVDRPKVLPDGMAGMWAVLPATGAVRLDSALDALARGARAAGDPRTLDQLRADLLVDLTAGDVEGTAARRALLPDAEATAPHGALAGPHGALAGPHGALAGPHGALAGPHGDVRGEASPSDVCGGVARADVSGGATPADVCGEHVPEDQSPAVADRAIPHRPVGAGPRTEIRVTVSLATLLGLDDAPADLAGYGPITAEAARALARDGTWRRIVTDPLSGRVLDVGRTRYRPPTDLVTHVRARDRECASPACSATAGSCDLDHTVEFHGDTGTTSADNLGPLCRRDHVVKTGGGFALRQVEPGVFEWLTPTGHRYLTEPGADAAYADLPGIGHSYADRQAGRVDAGEPPPF